MKTIFVVTILVVGALVAYALPTQVFADESETSTEQEINQSNRGSGSSTNVNCGDNDINSASEIEAQVCGTASHRPRRLIWLTPRVATSH